MSPICHSKTLLSVDFMLDCLPIWHSCLHSREAKAFHIYVSINLFLWLFNFQSVSLRHSLPWSVKLNLSYNSCLHSKQRGWNFHDYKYISAFVCKLNNCSKIQWMIHHTNHKHICIVIFFKKGSFKNLVF